MPAKEGVDFLMRPRFVIPAKAGIPRLTGLRDARFRGHDGNGVFIDTLESGDPEVPEKAGFLVKPGMTKA